MDDTESLLWDKSRRKRDFEDSETIDESSSKKSNIEINEDNKDTSKVESDNSVEEREGKAKSEKEAMEREVDKIKLKEDVDNEKNFTNEEIHEKLKAIDPVMAARLHPNNRRKVLR